METECVVVLIGVRANYNKWSPVTVYGVRGLMLDKKDLQENRLSR